MLIKIVIAVTIISVLLYVFLKFYRKCETLIEKMFYIIFAFMFIFVISLYYIDKYNIPTIFKWNVGVDTQKWLSILSDFGIGLIVETLGGIILFFVTVLQINRTLDDTRERDKEERRINNLPLLLYQISNNYPEDGKCHILSTLHENESLVSINLSIKNIGMNAVRDCYVEISSKDLKQNFICRLQEQGCIDKGDEKNINYSLYLNADDHNFNIIIYYEDLVHNWYSQEIELLYSVSNIYHNGRNDAYISFKVDNEKLLKEKPNKLSKM